MNPLATPSCADCLFYLFEDYRESPSTRAHRGNFCAHPAYLESYGIEQYLGATKPGEIPAPGGNHCLMVTDRDPVTTIREVSQNSFFWSALELRGPAISPVSRLMRRPS